jgi:hypothetical protein
MSAPITRSSHALRFLLATVRISALPIPRFETTLRPSGSSLWEVSVASKRTSSVTTQSVKFVAPRTQGRVAAGFP